MITSGQCTVAVHPQGDCVCGFDLRSDGSTHHPEMGNDVSLDGTRHRWHSDPQGLKASETLTDVHDTTWRT